MSFWGKLGKGLLKVAPYAAYAIPGVGPIAGAAIQAGLGAANAKVSGGGLKSALLGAGMGAGASAIGGKIPGLDKLGKGLAPSAGSGVKNALANVGKGTARNALSNVGLNLGSKTTGKGPDYSEQFYGQPENPYGKQGKSNGGSAFKSMLPRLIGAGGAITAGVLANRKKKPQDMAAGRARSPIGPTEAIPRMNQTRPNLAFPLLYGREEALGRTLQYPPYMSYMND